LKAWRHYRTQAALDAQFTLDTVADLPAVMQRRLDASAAARKKYRHALKLPYGERPEATLDLFYPDKGRHPAPIHMFIHGGFWKSLDAATFSFVADGFVPLGALVAVIDYPLIPNARMADIVAHIEAAIAWLFRHAAAHGGDPARLFVAGHSAGGHLASLAVDHAWPAARGLPDDVVKGGAALSAVFELEPLYRSFQQATLGLTAEDVARFSPQRHLPKRSAPLIVAVGGAETQEFVDQSLDYASARRGAGLDGGLIVAAQRHHIDILLDSYARAGEPLHAAVCRQMGIA
jgi:arylformamidase